ncbi:MAG: S9 family peptidase [Planctomycetes bacterium]|nr:S9 family peptidase [Planctomycetota bacterium]
MMKYLSILLIILLFLPSVMAEKRAMTVEDLWNFKRVGNIALSPDGKQVAYTVASYDMETNKSNTDIWMINTDGTNLTQVTNKPGYEGAPKWSPDGKQLGFLTTTDKGKVQIFSYDPTTGAITQKTDLPVDIDDYAWAPDSVSFLAVCNVYPDMTLEESNKKDEERINSKATGIVIDSLLYRHWNRWTYGKFSHVFYVNGETGEAKDLTPGKYDTPPISLGGMQDFTLSPDGKTFYFVRNTDKMVAISTNNDIFSVPLEGGEPTLITPNKGGDVNPVISPDGKYLAYTSMAREGFEADEQDLIVHNIETGEKTNLTEEFDRDVTDPIFANGYIYFYSYNHHKSTLYRVPVTGGPVEKLVDEHYNKAVRVCPDGKLVFLRQSVQLPFEIFTADADGKNVQQITFTNKDLLEELEMNPLETFWFTSFDNWRVQGLLVKPPFFDANKKYPVIFLIHGGPQGSWNDDFHFRWNLSLFAAPGYVVVAINPRGSKGYGQTFCDAVSGDWGGGPYKDLMAGFDKLPELFPFIDKDRIGAAGASYGGFMINWINGQTDRFKCLVSHAGLFDNISKYGSTEELWFPEWEFRGTPYKNPELYKKFSPLYYAHNFKTPTLVTHGQYDYRVDVSQGFQMFTALQRQGVPSRLIYFPDECHFVAKPQNARLWWNEVHKWFAQWLKK